MNFSLFFQSVALDSIIHQGFDFRTVTDDDVQFIEDLINNRPRECLGWKTPAEVLAESVALG